MPLRLNFTLRAGSFRSLAKGPLLRLATLEFLSAPYRKQRLLALCYHGVVSSDHSTDRFGYHNSVTPEEFAAHLDYLGKRYQFAGLSDVQRWMEGRWLGKPPVVVTFDDGYRNNVTIAAPILKQRGIPAVFFLTTGYIGTNRLLWTEEIVLRILSGPGRAITDCSTDSAVVVPEDLSARRRLAVRVRERLKKVSNAQRVQYLATFRDETDLDNAYLDRELNDFMSWEEARSLANMGFGIGSHTVEHPLLSRLPAHEVRTELRSSRLTLENELSIAVSAIAFPNGGGEDYDDNVIRECQLAGYRAAFTVADRFHEAGRSPFEISRIGVAGHRDLEAFTFYASGFRDRVRRQSA